MERRNGAIRISIRLSFAMGRDRPAKKWSAALIGEWTTPLAGRRPSSDDHAYDPRATPKCGLTVRINFGAL